jgi:hypothetical protein
MERPHPLTSSSFWPLPLGWSSSQILPWICLLVVASTTAYGLQLAAASMVPSTAADQRGGSYQALDSQVIREQRSALLQPASASSTRMVLITGEDGTTGDRRQLECATTSDRLATDALLVDLKDLGFIAAQLCSQPIRR